MLTYPGDIEDFLVVSGDVSGIHLGAGASVYFAVCSDQSGGLVELATEKLRAIQHERTKECYHCRQGLSDSTERVVKRRVH